MSPVTRDTITVGQLSIRFLVEGADSNGTVSVFEAYVPAKTRMQAPHSHDAFEAMVYRLEGVTTFTIDGEATAINPGDAVCVRRGQVHGFENRGHRRDVSLHRNPGVFGPAYFHEVGEVLAASAGGPPDLAAVGAVMHHHGLTPAAPTTTQA